MLENRLSENNILVGEIQEQVIDLSKEEQEKVVEPQKEDVVVLPDDAMKVLSKVTVKGVTADIDENIKAENIKLGVNILGIEGNVAPDKPDQEKTIYPSEEEQIVEADTGFELAKVIAKPVETESFEVVPSEEQQKIVASEGKFIKEVVVGAVENIEEELTEQETLLAELEEEVNGLSDKDDTALKILNGTLEDFDNTNYGLTEIRPYTFYKNSLKNVNLKGITHIGDYGMYENSIENLEGHEDLKVLGTYALASNNIKTRLNFNNLTNLGIHAFGPNRNIPHINISKNCNIKTMGSYAFHDCGVDRENPEQNIFTLDFTNSDVYNINSYAFNHANYYEIKFGEKVNTISSYVFNGSANMDIYFLKSTPPELNSLSFREASNIRIFVPYNSINAYKTATNWTTMADSIRGFAKENTFTQGQKLPLYSSEGYALTWYSDIDLTQQVTTADNPENYYYCANSAEIVEISKINSYVEDCEISIVDANNVSWNVGDYIPVGTQLTITVNPTIDGYVPYIQTINNETFTSPYTYTTISGKTNIVAVYYDGVNIPVGETFADTSWAVIKKVIQDGQASQYWQVGDTKPLVVEDSTYNVRLSDMQVGRYSYADGTKTTNAVLEFVEVLGTSYYIMNSTQNNAGGWANMELKTKINTIILEQLPIELQILLEEVVVASADGGGVNYTGITTSNNYLFIPCAEEVNLSDDYVREGEGTVWDYYINATLAKRLKRKPGYELNTYWWTRSPSRGASNSATRISSTGNGSTVLLTSTDNHIAPCWAW